MHKVTDIRLLATMFVLSTVLTGCDAFGFNRTPAVTKALLLRPDGKLDAAAATAAMNARFPPGSPFADLESFTQSLDGRCGHSHDLAWCEIPLHGVICDTRVMSLSVTPRPDGSIDHIQASEVAKTC